MITWQLCLFDRTKRFRLILGNKNWRWEASNSQPQRWLSSRTWEAGPGKVYHLLNRNGVNSRIIFYPPHFMVELSAQKPTGNQLRKKKICKRVKEKAINHSPFPGLKMGFLKTRINAISVLEPHQGSKHQRQTWPLEWQAPSWEPSLLKCSLGQRGPCEFSFQRKWIWVEITQL